MERSFGVAALSPKEYAMLRIAVDTATKRSAAISDRSAKKRRGSGKPFVRGRSGNPSGRPKRTPEELDLIAACRAKSPEALAVIENLMSTSCNDRVRMDAALAIIERAHGKPTQPTTLAGGAGGPIQVEAIRTDWVALRASIRERGTPGT
jgi:hypothetical protein